MSGGGVGLDDCAWINEFEKARTSTEKSKNLDLWEWAFLITTTSGLRTSIINNAVLESRTFIFSSLRLSFLCVSVVLFGRVIKFNHRDAENAETERRASYENFTCSSANRPTETRANTYITG